MLRAIKFQLGARTLLNSSTKLVMSHYVTFKNPLPSDKNNASLERNREYWVWNMEFLISWHDKLRSDPQLSRDAILRLEPPIPPEPYVCSSATQSSPYDGNDFSLDDSPSSSPTCFIPSTHQRGPPPTFMPGTEAYGRLIGPYNAFKKTEERLVKSLPAARRTFPGVTEFVPRTRSYSTSAGGSRTLHKSDFNLEDGRRGTKRKTGSSDDFSNPSETDGDPQHIQEQDRLILNFFNKNKQKDKTSRQKEELRKFLVKGIFNAGETMTITGSSASGFAFNTSDVDLCISMGSKQPVFERNTQVHILYRYKDILSRQPRIQKLFLIKAQVPLLTFRDYITGIKVEMNVKNDGVGERNTHLLYLYSQMDNRVPPLVLFIKFWAKSMCITDASKGTLSSYALTLMAIFFLQNSSPPVVPVIHDIVDCTSEQFLSSKPHFLERRNKQRISELFLEFLEFYSEFDFENNCISVRTGRCIPFNQARNEGIDRGDKSVNWKFIGVEEPFNRTNVSRAVYDKSRRDEIVSSFRRSHRIFQKNMDLSVLLRHLA